MKSTSSFFLFLGLLFCFFCSFSLVPAKKATPNPPITKKSKQQQQLEKRWKRTSNSRTKLHLEKKLQKLSAKTTTAPRSSLLAIFCFVLGTISIVLMIVAALANGMIGGALLFGIAFGLATLLGIIAVVLGIIYYNKRFKDKSKHPQPALAILGMVFGSITALIGILMLLTFAISSL